jgi:acetylornithine/succinyldiaminopimelate/putrescine aminotransferase
MTNNEVISLTDENIVPSYARFQVAIEKGKGATLWDFEGKKYIDFTSGIGVNSLGYGNQSWLDAINTQAAKLQHISNLFYTEPGAHLALSLLSAPVKKRSSSQIPEPRPTRVPLSSPASTALTSTVRAGALLSALSSLSTAGQ